MALQNMETPLENRHSLVALQASLAAIALDRRIRDHTASVDDVGKLVAILRSTIDPQPLGPASLLDPTAVELWTRALTQAHLDQTLPAALSITQGLSSLPEVTIIAKELISKLEQVSVIDDPDTLAQLRNFCLALSQSAQLEMPNVFGNTGFPELA